MTQRRGRDQEQRADPRRLPKSARKSVRKSARGFLMPWDDGTRGLIGASEPPGALPAHHRSLDSADREPLHLFSNVWKRPSVCGDHAAPPSLCWLDLDG